MMMTMIKTMCQLPSIAELLNASKVWAQNLVIVAAILGNLVDPTAEEPDWWKVSAAHVAHSQLPVIFWGCSAAAEKCTSDSAKKVKAVGLFAESQRTNQSSQKENPTLQ